MHLELLRVGGPVAVENRVVAVTGLVFVGVERILVRAGLIHEALAFGVDSEPGLRAHPEHLGGALLERFETSLVLRTQRRAVEHHGGVGFVHLRADPEAGLDAVAAGTRHGARVGDDAEVPGLERFHHRVVAGIAAGGNHGALLRDVADILPVAVLRDAARHAAVLIPFQLHHRGVEVKLRAALLRVLLENRAHHGLSLRVLLGGVAGGVVLVAGPVTLVAGFVHEDHALFLQTVAEPVDRFAGLISPELHEFLLQVAGGVGGRHGDVLKLIDLRAIRLLVAGVDRAEVSADAGANSEPVNTDHLAAVFGSRRDREHAAGPAANDENIGGLRIHDLGLRNLRGLAKPVAVLRFFGVRRDHFNRNLALRLRDALRGGFADSAGRDRSAGHGVDLRGLTGEQRLLQFNGGLLTNPGGFGRRVNHDIRDLIRVKGHLHDDVAADTGSLRHIGSRLIDAGGGRVGERGSRDRGTAHNRRAQELTA